MNNKFLILHHSSVSREKAKAQFYATGRFHKQKWGMISKLGYYHGYTHFMGTNGVITQTRSLDEEGMHTKGFNKDGHIGICIAGDFNIELPSQAQIASLRAFVKEHEDYTLKLHRDLQKNRTCPGKLFTRTWLNSALKETIKPDKEDKKKQKEIARLQTKLDSLLEILLGLIKKFHENN